MKLKVQLARPGAQAPRKAHPGDACYDLCASLGPNSSIVIHQYDACARIPLGIKTAIEPGWHAKLFLRSGMALKYGLSLQNGVGIVDEGYRDEWCAVVRNEGNAPFVVTDGMRICQFLLERTADTDVDVVDDLGGGDRGGGFGSTGSAPIA